MVFWQVLFACRFQSNLKPQHLELSHYFIGYAFEVLFISLISIGIFKLIITVFIFILENAVRACLNYYSTDNVQFN